MLDALHQPGKDYDDRSAGHHWSAPQGMGRNKDSNPKADDQREAQGRALQWFSGKAAHFRVLDPACGSGNFLYLALLSLKDLEHRVSLEGEALGLGRQFPTVGPEAVLGIELNPYAAELARVTGHSLDR
jgi:SAM-dependent methyltransferase